MSSQAPPMIGILAGMGPRSTAPFIDQVVTECQRQYGAKNDDEFPPMMIYALPTPFYLDRPIDHAALEAAICAGLQKLEQTGVAFIAMPCNSAHRYFQALAAAVHIPLLNMVEETLRVVPPASKKAILLATRTTVESGLYQEPLRKTGLEVVEGETWQNRVDGVIQAVKTSSGQAGNLWDGLLADIRGAGIDTAVLACTDLNAARSKNPGPLAILDATGCLARAAVQKWRDQNSRM